MAETKHTPGPWRAWDRGISKPRGDLLIRADDAFWTVTRMEHSNPDEAPQHIANAALIAAAPELYAALDALVQHTVITDSDELRAGLDTARAALAKARGEA